MKSHIVATAIAATLMAPTATFAQSVVFNIPNFFDEYSDSATKAEQPVTKQDTSTASTPMVKATEPAKDE